MPSAESTVRVVQVYPELLGLYGDGGNAEALVHRAKGHGIGIEVIDVAVRDQIPESGDLYLFGGGEDSGLLLASELLRRQPGLARILSGGVPTLAVCAGFQLLSAEFVGPDEVRRDGLGVLDVRCSRLEGDRAVGEVVAAPTGLAIGRLTGFENHQGDAVLGDEAVALARVVTGTGNGHRRAEGALQHEVVATYLHGPVLVRNPDLADHLLGRVVGRTLEPWRDVAVERLRRERFSAARKGLRVRGLFDPWRR